MSGDYTDWHFVTVTNPTGDGMTFEWSNRAGISWSLTSNYR